MAINIFPTRDDDDNISVIRLTDINEAKLRL